MSYINYDLVKSPVVTEKSTILGEQGKYIFKVAKIATKASVKKAIEQIFEVKVKSINIVNIKGKVKRFKGVIGTQSDTKKAVVTLEKDNIIDLAGGIK